LNQRPAGCRHVHDELTHRVRSMTVFSQLPNDSSAHLELRSGGARQRMRGHTQCTTWSESAAATVRDVAVVTVVWLSLND
jgi:hypothetical protein